MAVYYIFQDANYLLNKWRVIAIVVRVEGSASVCNLHKELSVKEWMRAHEMPCRNVSKLVTAKALCKLWWLNIYIYIYSFSINCVLD